MTVIIGPYSKETLIKGLMRIWIVIHVFATVELIGSVNWANEMKFFIMK